jgi:GNAT superfamily N-acetyltransferase
MRAHELQEIARMQPFNNLSKKNIDAAVKYKQVSKDAKPLPGGSGLTYSIKQKNQEIMISISDPTNEEVVGYLKVESDKQEKYFPIKNAHSVSMIAVAPEWRGQGIAKSLYGVYLSILKYPLLAGSNQTSGGRQNWLSLTKIPGVTVKGYVLIQDKNFNDEDSSVAFDKFIDSIMAMGGEYLGNSPSGKLRYFAFDVEPGNGELQPAVKKQLQLYSNTSYLFHQEVGLYAIWNGE